jgi:hypothetical protein
MILSGSGAMIEVAEADGMKTKMKNIVGRLKVEQHTPTVFFVTVTVH